MKPLTTRQVGELLQAPEWLVRRIVDALPQPVDKFGHKRMIPTERVPEIKAAIEAKQSARRGVANA